MGKRKSAKKVAKKARPRVMGSFDCMYCHHTGSIRISINKKAKIGNVRCSQCNVDWSTTTTALSEPIDIFCEWVDAAEEANADRPAAASGGRASGARASRDDSDADDDDFGGDDSD
eukprot:Tamp_23633.p2 GENE.Tamp_23633~~Tamp_23633.p2  ORF type:complete len:116 (+),score=32.07 Tamp_23633:80-427(+)